MATEPIVQFGQKDAARIARVVRHVERDGGRGTPMPLHRPNAKPYAFVKVTSTTQTNGKYPGTIQQFVGSSNTFTAIPGISAVWLRVEGGVTVAANDVFVAFLGSIRTSDGLAEWVAFDRTGGGGTFIGVRCLKSADQSITSGVLTAVTFDGESFDTDTMHSNVSNTSRITFNTAGKYHVGGNIVWDNVGIETDVEARLRLNGTTAIFRNLQTHRVDTFDKSQQLGTIYDFAAGDYVETMVQQNSGGSVLIITASSTTAVNQFWAFKIDPAAGGGAGAAVDPAQFEARLTPSTGNPVYHPQGFLIPSATSQANDTVDFAAAHGWESGTAILTTETNSGTLLPGVVYYVNATDTDTVSFHTSVADALTAANKANLTANFTATQKIYPVGKGNTTIYLTPHNGNKLVVNGAELTLSSDASLALSVTSGTPADVWVRSVSGTPTLDKTDWTNVTTRATALVTTNGVKYKSGDATRRWVGTVYPTATNTVEMTALVAGIQQADDKNRVNWPMAVWEAANSWTYSTQTTWRAMNGSSANKLTIINGARENGIHISGTHLASCDVDGGYACLGIGINSTTVNSATNCANVGGDGDATPFIDVMSAQLTEEPRLGLTEYTALESIAASVVTMTWYSLFDDEVGFPGWNLPRRSGLTAVWRC